MILAGPFTEHASLVKDLVVADEDEEAASRLGITHHADLIPTNRRTELANWLKHVLERTASS